MALDPKFEITPAIARALLEIERHKEAIEHLPVSTSLLTSLRESARLMSTHYSTQIEGNALTPREVEQVVNKGKMGFPGRERDEQEVQNYYKALEEVERLSHTSKPLLEEDIQRIHGIVMKGKPNATPYRDGQNIIQDGLTGNIVYMPPEYSEVPTLMKELTEWINRQIETEVLPVAIIAALAHYQYATIHPYYDGNGRTARLLTTLILHKCGYDLKGIYSLEEYYAKNLKGYYSALNIDNIPNYYMGRAQADTTAFIDYFCQGMADSFSRIRASAEDAEQPDQSKLLRKLTARQKQALTLFTRQGEIRAAELAKHLSISPRSAAELCIKWVEQGFIVIGDPAKRSRTYCLHSDFESLVVE